MRSSRDPSRAAHAFVVALLAALLSAPAAAAQTPSVAAERLARDPVVVGGGMRDALPARAAGRVRLRIAELAVGRLRVVVVSSRALRAAGGAAAYVNAVAAAAPVRGALLVTSGTDWHVVTSYPRAEAAVGALTEAVGGGRAGASLEARLLAAVEGLAAVDPGADADTAGGGAGPGSAVPAPEAEAFLEGLGTTLRWVLIGLAAAIGAPFVVVTVLVLWRTAARHRAAEADHEDRLRVARERLVAVGDGLRELDAHESAPGAAPAGRASYGVVLERYDAADALLRGEVSPRALRRALRSLDEAEAGLAAARVAFGVAPAAAPTTFA